MGSRRARPVREESGMRQKASTLAANDSRATALRSDTLRTTMLNLSSAHSSFQVCVCLQ